MHVEQPYADVAGQGGSIRLVCLLLATGCAGLLTACHTTAGEEEASPPSRERSSEETDVVASADSLSLRLEMPERVATDEPVPITLEVRNVTDRSIDLYLTGRPIAFDLVVTEEDGEVVWRRLEGEVIPMVLRIETLEPGVALEFEETWDQRSNAGEFVPPGTYTVRGKLLTEDEPLVTPESRLRIGPS